MLIHIRKITTAILFAILLISLSFYYYYLYLSGNGIADKSDPLYQYKYKSWDDYCQYYKMDCGSLDQSSVTILGDGFIYDDKAYYLFGERVPYHVENERDQAYQKYLAQYIQKPVLKSTRYSYQSSEINKILDWDGNMAMINDDFYVQSTSYYGVKGEPRILSSNLFRDAHKIFFSNNLSTLFISDVDFVDPRTFEVLNVNALYSKDKNRVYYGLRIVPRADAKSFVVHPKNINFAYDDFYVFYQNYLIENADVKTFDVLSDKFSKDADHVYIENVKVAGADPKTFEVVNRFVGKDANNTYVGIQSFNDIDTSTLKALNELYTWSASHVFYLDSPIENVDVETFTVLNDQYPELAKDRNYLYNQGIQVAIDDLETFESINEKYAKDSVNYYCLPLMGQKETGYPDRKPISAVDHLEFDFQCFEPQS